jgi:hypothetical protein
MTINLTCHLRLLNPISLRLKGEKMQMAALNFLPTINRRFPSLDFAILAPPWEYNFPKGGLPCGL